MAKNEYNPLVEMAEAYAYPYSWPQQPSAPQAQQQQAAPYNPYATPLYQSALGTANWAKNNSYVRTKQYLTNSLSDIGANTQWDAPGWRAVNPGIDWASVDMTNPFSKAALLKQSYETSQRGTKNSLAARGLLRSGAYQNSLNTIQRNFDQGKDSLNKELQRVLEEANIQYDEATTGEHNAIVRAMAEALAAAPQPG